ncbi:hypothetical protein [Mariniblastus fucicola]|uniref:Uncharacterized protein n=1 Tax=Mariniblastus fucicola TaxID=980251 RepID=A0A5B9P2U0_9BACT|nr:hypothetical protein [Mariniblastus fucicola]QEG20678.1 hypothetical protein MFFC18_05280 [Mariniblastus fucicola]
MTESKQHLSRKRRTELVAVGAFIVVNLLAPVVVGEMYPFTISPMFCDQPKQYCTYQLFDQDGKELDLEAFGLHLVYDGNPPGLGMGIEAAPQLHGFGEVPELDEVVAHVRKIADEDGKSFRLIRVCQSVVGCNGTCPEAKVREAIIEPTANQQPTE